MILYNRSSASSQLAQYEFCERADSINYSIWALYFENNSQKQRSSEIQVERDINLKRRIQKKLAIQLFSAVELLSPALFLLSFIFWVVWFLIRGQYHERHNLCTFRPHLSKLTQIPIKTIESQGLERWSFAEIRGESWMTMGFWYESLNGRLSRLGMFDPSRK